MVNLDFVYITIQVLRVFMTLAFLGSLFVFLAPEAYAKVSRVLVREYGIKKRFIPWLEIESKNIDAWVLKRRGIFGALFITISFVLLVAIR
jgi:hypothetical protein